MQIDITKKSWVKTFRNLVYDFYTKNSRDQLPWRTHITPYRIFISEVMLQQTQVERVIPKFNDFVSAFPDFKSLADADLKDVLGKWQGLGYNRRAKALRDAAGVVVSQFNGALPDNPEKLVLLPGIGKATAASITAFAFNKPTLFLETNIRTVFIHHFFTASEAVTDEMIIPLAQKALDTDNPFTWYSALMDYGTFLKKQHGNATKKSKGYKKQSSFKGSRRELRGKILKVLLQQNGDAQSVARQINADYSSVLPILNELAAESLVKETHGIYSI